MAPTTHTETHPLVFGQEVSFGSIAGPTDFIDVFVDANAAKNAIVEWRVYATVGSLVSRVGTSPGGGSVASVLKWSGPQGPYSPLAANGSSYELRAYWAQPGPVPTMKASIVGYDEFDTVADTDASASEQIPASFAEVEFANAVGYSQFADVAVTQQFTGNVNFTLYALAEAGGVEAAVASQPLQNPNDSTTRIFSNLKLPGATSYSLRANNISTTGVGPTIAASLACYSTVASGSGGVVQLAGQTSGPSNANKTQYFTQSFTNENVIVDDDFANVHGLNFLGMNGMTTSRNIELSETPEEGDVVVIKAEDATFESFDINVNGNDFLIDGSTNYTMTVELNGKRGAISLLFTDGEWNVIIGPTAPGIATLEYWLRADLGVTLVGVSEWADQSGAGDANRNVAQSIVAQRPTYNPSDPRLNGQASLSFLHSKTQWLDMPGLWSNAPFNEPYTIIAVGYDDGTEQQPWVGDQLFNNWYLSIFGDPAAPFNYGSSIGPDGNYTGAVGTFADYQSNVTSDASPIIYYAEFNDLTINTGVSTVRISNDTAAGQVLTNVGTGGGPGFTGAGALSQLRIGGSTGTTQSLTGALAEVIIISGILSDVDRQGIEAYLSQRYAITVANLPPGTVPIQPSELGSNLELWLRADLGITASVSNWADQSGQGQVDVVQPTAGNQPIFHQNDSNFNNQSVLAFISSPFSSLTMSGPWIDAIEQPYTMVVVGADGATGSEAFLGDESGDNWYVAALSATYGASVGATLLGTTPDGTSPVVLFFEANDPNSTIRVSELTAEATGNAGFGSPLPRIEVGGANNSGAAPLNPGRIAEVRIYKGLLTTDQRTEVLNELGSRYAIAIGS